MSRSIVSAVVLLCALVSACAAPNTVETQASNVQTTPAAPDVAAVPVKQPPPMSRPLPPERVDAPRADAPARVDRSCKTNADCAVKDVGNCCGTALACVNVNSPTDPAGVRAQCAKQGRMSICGFKPVEGCECVKGQCSERMMEFEAR